MMWAGCWELVKTSPGLTTEGSHHPGPQMEGTVIETQEESLQKENFLPRPRSLPTFQSSASKSHWLDLSEPDGKTVH